jgi:hypothetical protein
MYFQLEKEQDKMNLDLMIPLFLSKILMDNYNHYPYLEGGGWVYVWRIPSPTSTPS